MTFSGNDEGGEVRANLIFFGGERKGLCGVLLISLYVPCDSTFFPFLSFSLLCLI